MRKHGKIRESTGSCIRTTSGRMPGARTHPDACTRPACCARPACPAFSKRKKSLPRLHVSHETAVPANPPLHASAPSHAVACLVLADAHLVSADARLVLADAHAGGGPLRT
jgi:hypothetical protein